uniref:Uncharacterized protein n=1 Tax=viral metagenome TaxID=1070528 RepID=A0A6C0H7Q7_9ZZZZ
MDNIYISELIHDKIVVNINKINEKINELLEKMIEEKNGGKCILNGYIKKNTVKLKTYSSPIIYEDGAIFDVVYEAEVCNPVKNMIIKCKVESVIKPGIEAYLYNETYKTSPFIVYISRDLYYDDPKFLELKENDIFMCRVISSKFGINDQFITIYASVI